MAASIFFTTLKEVEFAALMALPALHYCSSISSPAPVDHNPAAPSHINHSWAATIFAAEGLQTYSKAATLVVLD